ncbi:hypothetical protein N3K66_001939 [Trichothecium roseum]|uniref:Uncharacterized protein n=1 Tax=Trichothecium roseum TaxID=47278 RepID=A0ACC0V9M1_9HYPO|nr:hypothetical protein N3K66_001939 [Trichothecium roseum]
MDWVYDYQVCDVQREPTKVFKYSTSETKHSTTVVRVEPGNESKESSVSVATLVDDEDWEIWFNKEHPPTDGSSSGLVLVMFRLLGEKPDTPATTGKVDADEWLKTAAGPPSPPPPFPPHDKGRPPIWEGGQRALRTLPVTSERFVRVAAKFHVHKSIVRTVSRADVPAISADEVLMADEEGKKWPSYVYSCRSSNAWKGDLALAATHFPHCGMTFAVMFGCTAAIEADVVRRLASVSKSASAHASRHPALLPGMFVELERRRHGDVVEAITQQLEQRIYEVESRPEQVEALSAAEKARRIEARKEAWLNTAYLKSQLISWNCLLEGLERHLDELRFDDGVEGAAESCGEEDKAGNEDQEGETGETKAAEPDGACCSEPTTLNGSSPAPQSSGKSDESPEAGSGAAADQGESGKDGMQASVKLLRQTTGKIRSRVRSIIHEYNERIRECAMRVEGMAMATQWAQGETNIEIALSTARESQHMRSIAIVTMLFLPGTFFATIFSMDLFDWTASSGDVVSRYFWIYIVMATLLTFLTLFCWWFFGVRRVAKKKGGGSGTNAAVELQMV